MKKFTSVFSLMLAFVIFSSNIMIANSSSNDLIINGILQKNSYISGEFPVIIGRVMDPNGNPLPNANVTAFFEVSQSTSTLQDGTFEIKSTTPATLGNYIINVTATKEGFDSGSLFVNINVEEFENSLSDLASDPLNMNQVQTQIEDSVANNPISQILLRQIDNMKKQQQEEQERLAEIKVRNQHIETQRALAQERLEADLKSVENNIENSRIAFASFVKSTDEFVQEVFWGQFAFTEQKTIEAQKAKIAALEDGMTSEDAMKIFQRKAASSKKEVVAHNMNLQIQLGFANNTSQELADEYGKFPRDD